MTALSHCAASFVSVSAVESHLLSCKVQKNEIKLAFNHSDGGGCGASYKITIIKKKKVIAPK